VYGCVALLNYHGYLFARRLLDPLPFGFLLLSTIMNQAVFCEAQYLRTHKAEPFVWLAISLGIATAASTFLVAKPFGAVGVSAGYLISCTAGLIIGTRIYVKKRKEWHV
jgi:hypothetical protein